MAGPPVRNAMTWSGSHSSNLGVDALKGKLNTAFFGSKPFNSFVKTSRHRRDEIFRLSGRYLLLIGVFVAMRHDFMTAALQFVPETEVAHRPAMIFVG